MPSDVESKIISNPDHADWFMIYGELIEKHENLVAEFEASKCSHGSSELRKRTLANGANQLRFQCLTCGISIGQAKKQAPSNIDSGPWDDILAEKYQQLRDNRREEIQRGIIAEQKSESAELERKSLDWQIEYSAYRRSPSWQRKRLKVFHRANGFCEGCADAPAVVVHHLDYSNMGDELLFQLVALCEDCHRKAHPEHNEPEFYDNDYMPCMGCRWGIDGSKCGKYDVFCYVALSHEGECGPAADGYEGLK